MVSEPQSEVFEPVAFKDMDLSFITNPETRRMAEECIQSLDRTQTILDETYRQMCAIEQPIRETREALEQAKVPDMIPLCWRWWDSSVWDYPEEAQQARWERDFYGSTTEEK
jgi:hypothetical protein